MSNLKAKIGAFLLLLLSSLTVGATPLYTVVGGNADTNGALTLGLRFTPTTSISVYQLGVYDGGSDGPGLQTDHDVGLWNSSGTLLASSTVLASSTLDDGFRYVTIVPIVLLAGQTYTLGAYYALAGDKAFLGTPTFSGSVVGDSRTYVATGGALANPTNINGSWRTDANLQFTTASVPEPISLALLGLGLLGLGWGRRFNA